MISMLCTELVCTGEVTVISILATMIVLGGGGASGTERVLGWGGEGYWVLRGADSETSSFTL